MKLSDATLAKRVTEFWNHVRQGRVDECWPWTGYVNDDDYGEFYFAGQMTGAHELAVTFTTGEIRIDSLDTCHSQGCTTRLCCNPGHLRFDTRASNVADTVANGRNHIPASRLTDVEVQEMRRRRAHGASQLALADAFGVSEGLVSMIVHGKKRLDAGGPITPSRPYSRKESFNG